MIIKHAKPTAINPETEVVFDRLEMALYLLAHNDISPQRAVQRVEELIKAQEDFNASKA